MARVTFSDPHTAGNRPQPQPQATERAPLLQPSQRAYNQHQTRPQSILLPDGSSASSKSFATADSKNGTSYLPLHRRHRGRGLPDTELGVWSMLLRAGMVVMLLCFACVAVIALADGDILRHPTGPHPAPPPARPGSDAGEGTGSAQHANPAVLVQAKHGAVATENKVCSDMGVDVLKRGGNAVDAAVTATLCIGVVNLFSSGIGGGGFMTVRLSPTPSSNGSSSVWVVDFRETAPGASNKTMFVDDPLSSLFGGLSVGVPGELRGLEEAHSRWGALPWADVVQPAADLAAGWKVGKELAIRIRWPFFEPMIFHDPTWRALFAPEGRLLEEGEIARRPALARTLSTIAAGGADVFYTGAIAEAIVRAVQGAGGILTHADLANYTARVYPALSETYRGRRVYTPGAPTGGPVLLHMLNLLERYDLEGEGRTGLNTHRFIEVMKFGFAARTKICDPSFVDDMSRIEKIPTKAYSELIARNITDDTTHTPDYYNPVFDAPIDHGTSHISIVDKNGMAVAITSTVNLIFGSQLMDPVTGILFNDEMNDFSTPGIPNAFGLWPSPWNYPEPHKRPLSSTVPTIVEHADGSFYLALGGSGGTKIFPSVAQVLLGIDAWGLDPSAAVEWGRVHDQLYPQEVEVDSTLGEDVRAALRARGHNVTVLDIDRVAAVVQVVMKTGDTIYAASDSRKNGIAAGY